jgi:hypothetical protein
LKEGQFQLTGTDLCKGWDAAAFPHKTLIKEFTVPYGIQIIGPCKLRSLVRLYDIAFYKCFGYKLRTEIVVLPFKRHIEQYTA